MASPLVAAGVVRWDLDRLYLDRYHRLETQVCDDLRARTDTIETPVDEARLEATAALLRGTRVSEQQLQAAMNAARHRTTILTGGPGTGKTTTVARMLVLLADQAGGRDETLSIALAAPTGKAATRLEEAVEAGLAEIAEASPEARAAAERVGHPRGVTLHRLLGWRPDNSTRFRHDRSNRLKFDVVVVDESSMVELTMMGRLLEALRPQARLVLVGDPEQLTSVGAGAVLSDLVEGYGTGPDSPVEPLTENFRSTEDIKALAEALRVGDADGVLDVLRTPSDQVEFVEVTSEAEVEAALRPDCEAAALRVLEAALREEPQVAVDALDEHRLLCAHREGPAGVRRWNRHVERWLAERPGVDALRRVVRRPAAARHQQRLRARRLQRRDRRRRPSGPAPPRVHLGLRRAQGARTRAPRRGRDHARAHHPQEPGQPGQGGVGAAAGRRLAAAHPRALLHRGHPRPGARSRGRHRGRGPARRRHQGPPSDPAAPAAHRFVRTLSHPETRALPASPRVG